MKSFMAPDFLPSDTSGQLVYSGIRLDRISEEREEDCLEKALANPKTQCLGFSRGRLLLKFSGENEAQGSFPFDALAPFSPSAEKAILMGYEKEVPYLAVPLGINPDAEDFSLPEPFKAIDFRSLAIQGLLSHSLMGMVAYGGSMLVWHATNRYCSKCGNPSESRIGGAKRVCTSCEKEHFPRTDPVVIMLTVSGDKCLLGRSPHFPPGMYSALAGFVEQGETLEGAVRRETFEESGIRVGKVSYHASQPWPFPHSLMIGCYGEALDENIVMDDIELDDCRWFTRDELKKIMAGEGPTLEDGSPQFFTPPKMAIASRLVSDWVKGDI